jgi:hypothetical protein
VTAADAFADPCAVEIGRVVQPAEAEVPESLRLHGADRLGADRISDPALARKNGLAIFRPSSGMVCGGLR